ncbi:hypothetical protein [Treponema zioleckii]|nr:hypothetical protein [Treponema zioleckii]
MNAQKSLSNISANKDYWIANKTARPRRGIFHAQAGCFVLVQ